MTRCFFCNNIVDPDYVYRRIRGWERKAVAASRRGGSDIVLREQMDEYACDRCVFRLQHHLAPAQESAVNDDYIEYVAERIDPLDVLRELDGHARELDDRSKQLAQTDRDLEPVEAFYEEFLGTFEAGLWEQHLAGAKFPPEALRRRMAHREMPASNLGEYTALVGQRKRLMARISTLKTIVDAKRSVISALKAEMDAAR